MKDHLPLIAVIGLAALVVAGVFLYLAICL
jgi:hypothetical protein